LEVVATAVTVPYGQCKILNAVHHTCLKDVFQKLIVVYGTASLYLDDDPAIGAYRIGIKELVNPVVQPEQHWDWNSLSPRFSSFDFEAERFQMGLEVLKHTVAVQGLFRRPNIFMHRLEALDDLL
jgi:hypothetical protein